MTHEYKIVKLVKSRSKRWKLQVCKNHDGLLRVRREVSGMEMLACCALNNKKDRNEEI